MSEPRSGVAESPADELAEEFVSHRPRLLGIAYRLLGSAWDAEDVVAEAWVRWQRVDRARVREPVAFLTTVVTRLALDQLRSARATRERYVGPWLPEPVLTGASSSTSASGSSSMRRSTPVSPSSVAASGPLDTLERREAASLATLRMMEMLSPPERAVLVMHEAFDVPYGEIAEILDVTVDAARQHLHRARARLRAASDAKRFEPDPHAHEALFERFLDALDGGDLDALRDLLAADVVAYSDGGGKVRAALHPLEGADRVVRFYGGLRKRLPLSDVRRVEVNGRPAALLRFGEQLLVLSVEGCDGRVSEVHSVLNPDKLRYLQLQLAARGH